MNKNLVTAILFAAIILLLLVIAMPAAASDIPVQPNVVSSAVPSAVGFCECVDYVVYKLPAINGRRAPGNWPTAFSMASSAYWSQYGYNRRDGAGNGDVIIIGPSVNVGVPKAWWGDMSYNFNPSWAGHIGIVTRADYDGRRYGWYIQMRSANWDVNYNQMSDAGCNNVGDSIIFVPNGNDTSFWHRN